MASLDAVVSSLQQYVATPNNDASNAFKGTVENFRKTIDQIPSPILSPSMLQAIDEIGAKAFIGSNLTSHFNSLLSTRSITPAELFAAIQDFIKQLKDYLTKIDSLDTLLRDLNLERESLDPGEFEFGVVLPRKLVGNTVEGLKSELQHINRLFLAINELRGASSESVEVRTIGSSWWQFFLSLDSVQISAIVFAIERIVNLFKTNLEIKKLRQETSKYDMGEELAAIFDKRIEDKLKEGLAGIAKEVRAQIQNNKDKDRCNELENWLRMELLHIAKRINQGGIYEVRAALPPAVTDPSDAEKADPTIAEAHTKALRTFEKAKELADKVNQTSLMLTDRLSDVGLDQPLLIDYEKEAVEEEKREPEKKDAISDKSPTPSKKK